jgi:trans-aconitate methyltransferase
MDPREHWRTVYATKAPEEVSWFEAEPQASLRAMRRLDVAPDTAIVDVGAGASRLADALLDLGFSDVTLLDIAEGALATSRARLGARAKDVSWEVADVRHWRPQRSFDLWHDRAVFHFLTDAADRDQYRRTLIEATHRGSLVVLATFAPDGPEQCSGLTVRRYDADGLAKELGESFVLREAWREEHETPWGAKQSFQWAAFERC